MIMEPTVEECTALLNARPTFAPEQTTQQLCVAIVSDFQYPRKGGVETHQLSLALELRRRSHKVVCITNTYGRGSRQGVRWLCDCGIKFYYLPIAPVIQQSMFPVFFVYLRLLRCILIRERVMIVHTHQSPSILAELALIHCHTLGIPTVFTDHSLYGFGDLSSIHLNKLMKHTLTEVGAVIAVSHASKENVVLRACLEADTVRVIPNAVDCCKFHPRMEEVGKHEDEKQDSRMDQRRITIVMVQRLAFRKGMGLACEVIPKVCALLPNVDFLIGGGGPMMADLEKMLHSHSLQSRVTLLGQINHSDVPSVLVRGDLFLCLSLTEAFCIGIVEAAAVGLFVVSTDVGAVSEVLPSHMVELAPPECDAMVRAVQRGIEKTSQMTVEDRLRFHCAIKSAYSWQRVAQKTELVYYQVLKESKEARNRGSRLLSRRLRKYRRIGPVSGLLMAFVVIVDWLWLCVLEWMNPTDEIEIAVDFPETDFGTVTLPG